MNRLLSLLILLAPIIGVCQCPLEISPRVDIVQSRSTSICPNEIISFSIKSLEHTGSDVKYQWRLNGKDLLEYDSVLYLTNVMDGDLVSLTVRSTFSFCRNPIVETFSNTIKVSVLPVDTLKVHLDIDPADGICKGEEVRFVANVQNGGPEPLIEWFVNDSPVPGLHNTTFSSFFNEQDVVSVRVASNAKCPFPHHITVNKQVEILPELTPRIRIDQKGEFFKCKDDIVQLTASIINGGLEPNVEWYVNGLPQGLLGNFFKSDLLNEGDSVYALLKSSYRCSTTDVVSSEKVIIKDVDYVKAMVDFDRSNRDSLFLFTKMFVPGKVLWSTNGSGSFVEMEELTVYLLSDEDRSATHITFSVVKDDLASCMPQPDHLYVDLKVILSKRAFSNNNILLYPNPAADRVYLDGINDIRSLTIINEIGQRLLFTIYDESFDHIDVRSLKPGLYLVEIDRGGSLFYHRFYKSGK